MGREGRRDAVEIARQEKNRWKKRALNVEETLGKVREYIGPAENGPWHSTYRFDILAILDESPTERETPADERGVIVNPYGTHPADRLLEDIEKGDDRG